MNWLSKIGHVIVNIFTKAAPVINTIQQIATPFENVYAPGLSQAINIGLQTVFQFEALGVNAATGADTNAKKLAAVIAALGPQLAPTLASVGITNPTNAEYTKFVNAIVAAASAFQIPASVIVPVNTTTTGVK